MTASSGPSETLPADAAGTTDTCPRLPDFLLIGGVRCGTTSMYTYLKEHPAVFMCEPKEPAFFARRSDGDIWSDLGPKVTRWPEYQDLFRNVGDAHRVGEASAIYLYRADRAAPRIRDALGDVRLIAILRHPVDRAYSQYRMAVREGEEDVRTFREALAREEERVAEGSHPIFHYRRQSLYSDRIATYRETFGRQRLRVYVFRDFIEDPTRTVRDAFEFIGVDPGYIPDTSRPRNVTRSRRNSLLERLVEEPNPVRRVLRAALPSDTWNALASRVVRANMERPGLDADLRQELLEFYEPEVRRVEELLDRDLSHWRQ